MFDSVTHSRPLYSTRAEEDPVVDGSIGRRFTSSRPILGSTERWHSAIQSTASGSNILSPVRPVVPSRRYTDPAASTKQLVRSASSTEHAISKADGSLFS